MKKTVSVFLALFCTVFLFAALTPAAAAEEKIRVACCGDSITEGWTSSDLDTCSYPGQLGKMLDESRYEVKNYGAGGRCALKEAGDYKAYWDERDFYKASLVYKPNVVILMLGTNDVVCNQWQEDGANYRADLADLVRSYQALESHPTVYLCTPCYSTDASHTEKIQNVAAPIVREVASETGATLVDVNEYTKNYAAEGGLNPDGIHLSDDGYLRLAGYFYDVIFNGACSNLTVAAENGVTVSCEGSNIPVTENKAVLRLANGEKTVTLRDRQGNFGTFTINLTGDTVADCRSLELAQNFAIGATVIASDLTNANAVCDGDEATAWQVTEGDYDEGLWIGYDFGTAKTFDTVDFVWEQDSRPTDTGYAVQISEDGEEWISLVIANNEIFSARSTVSFHVVTSRFVRVKIGEVTNDKYFPKLAEMRVMEAKTLTPVFTDGTEIDPLTSEAEENEKGNILVYLLVSAGIVIVAGLAAAFTVHKQKNEKDKPNTIG